MTAELMEHYSDDRFEDTRLRRSPHGRLEFMRTQELIRRWLPAAKARILDIGGGTGVHAEWLAADGHAVHVIDVVQAAAARNGVSAELGDARNLSHPDESIDVALLLGPLYHLVDEGERALALAEASRVRSGGLPIAAGISRYLSLLEVGSDGRLTEEIEATVAAVISTGRYDGHVGFVDACFHTADGLRAELIHAGLRDVSVLGVEGPAWPALDRAGMGQFEGRVDAKCAIVEQTSVRRREDTGLTGR
jgi:SAM-dependent methyltransferase